MLLTILIRAGQPVLRTQYVSLCGAEVVDFDDRAALNGMSARIAGQGQLEAFATKGTRSSSWAHAENVLRCRGVVSTGEGATRHAVGRAVAGPKSIARSISRHESALNIPISSSMAFVVTGCSDV